MRYLTRAIIFVITAGLLLSCSSEEKQPQLGAEASYKKALELIKDKEYEKARNLLSDAKAHDDTKQVAPLAQLKIAETHQLAEEFELAVTEYREFLRAYPTHRFAPYAQFQIAESYFIQIQGEDREYLAAESASNEYKKLIEQYPRNPYDDIVKIRMQQCRDTLADHEKYVGEYYLRKGKFNAAINRFRYLLEKYPDYTKIQDIYYLMGLSFIETKEMTSAREFLTKAASSSDKNIADKAQRKLRSIRN